MVINVERLGGWRWVWNKYGSGAVRVKSFQCGLKKILCGLNEISCGLNEKISGETLQCFARNLALFRGEIFSPSGFKNFLSPCFQSLKCFSRNVKR